TKFAELGLSTQEGTDCRVPLWYRLLGGRGLRHVPSDRSQTSWPSLSAPTELTFRRCHRPRDFGGPWCTYRCPPIQPFLISWACHIGAKLGGDCEQVLKLSRHRARPFLRSCSRRGGRKGNPRR